MDNLEKISLWLAKQHVVSWCVATPEEMWCANAFYYYDPQRVAFWLLSDTHTRHGRLTGTAARVAGTVNGQPKTVALIRGVQFAGQIRLLEGAESDAARSQYCRRFPVARAMSAPVWEIRLDELKFTDNTLGFGKKFYWARNPSGTEQA
ncbi:YhbP family protein [Siccibacter turicensis]|uniref:YhbP family protein n=1 Tax=Siccibacter turicensis TaxID=357233 RepID=UPI003F5665F6